MVVSSLPTSQRSRTPMLVSDGSNRADGGGRRVFVVGDYVDSGALLADGAAASARRVVSAIAARATEPRPRSTIERAA
jgi:hypothetical protein